MFIANSKAGMDYNRSFDGNRMMNATLSRDINGLGDTYLPGFNEAVRASPGSPTVKWIAGLGEDVVETSYAKQTALGALRTGRYIPAPRAVVNPRRGRMMREGYQREPYTGGDKETSDNTYWMRSTGGVYGLGDDALVPVDSSSSWAGDLLNIVKTALPIYQQQQIFNQQLSVAKATGQPVMVNTQAGNRVVVPPMNWGKVALIGGGGVLGLVLLMKMMR